MHLNIPYNVRKVAIDMKDKWLGSEKFGDSQTSYYKDSIKSMDKNLKVKSRKRIAKNEEKNFE